MLKFWKRKPEPARANTSTPEGVLEKAGNGKVWLITFFDREGRAKKHVVATNLRTALLSGDGWNKVAKNTYARQTEKGYEIVHLRHDGRVERWFFNNDIAGEALHRIIATISQVEVVQ